MIKKSMRFIIIATIIFSIFLSVLVLDFYHFLYTPLSIPKDGYVLVIDKGASVRKIAAQLVKAQLLPSSSWFLLAVGKERAWHKLKAGEYLINYHSTPLDLIQQLQEGRVIQYALTIVPGWNFERLMLEVNQSDHLTHTLRGLTVSEIMVKLGYPGEHPEGQFLPETYYFPAGTTDVAFLQRASILLRQKLADLWCTKQTPLKTPYEALILASIIEKESAFPDEYNEIAGVYVRRLLKNMPLQADPTVIYGAGSKYTGVLTTELLAEPTPYNTYQRAGLPPTPIALPSVKAIEAALHPKAGTSLYFVAKPNGKGHVFSKNLREHTIAVIKYRKTLLKVE